MNCDLNGKSYLKTIMLNTILNEKSYPFISVIGGIIGFIFLSNYLMYVNVKSYKNNIDATYFEFILTNIFCYFVGGCIGAILGCISGYCYPLTIIFIISLLTINKLIDKKII
jgi:hypothetical protein